MMECKNYPCPVILINLLINISIKRRRNIVLINLLSIPNKQTTTLLELEIYKYQEIFIQFY